MTPRAVLAVVEHGPHALPWQADLVEVIRRHSRARDYDPGFSVVDALVERGLLDVHGRRETRPVSFRQPVGCYVEQFHSTSSLARELMPEEEWRRFDASVAEVVGPWAEDGVLDMRIAATVAWGRPG